MNKMKALEQFPKFLKHSSYIYIYIQLYIYFTIQLYNYVILYHIYNLYHIKYICIKKYMGEKYFARVHASIYL